MFIGMTAQARMPAGVRARYRRVAVVETAGTEMPKQIHPRHKAVKRIVAEWPRCNVGKAVSSAYVRALAQAEAMAAELNAGVRA